jgi:hypothetical protein
LKKENEEIQKIKKQNDTNQIILADNNQKNKCGGTTNDGDKRTNRKHGSKIYNIDNTFTKFTTIYKFLDLNMNKLEKENKELINDFKNLNEEQMNTLAGEISKIFMELTKQKNHMDEQIKILKESMLQNKTVNNAVCGKIEKLDDLINYQSN